MASKKTVTAQNTYEGSSGTPNIGTISTGTYIYNGEDYSNELAVLRSNLDEITKIKVIQALKKNEYNSWWTDPKKWEPTWTCTNGTGNGKSELMYNTNTSGSTTNLNTKSSGNTIANQVYM